jgi:large subunit ribosomal protein L21
MYAIVETGGKQYKVKVGDRIYVEKLAGEVGDSVELPVIAVFGEEGFKQNANAKVTAKIESHGKGRKVIVFKYKPKKNYRRKQGHRQPYTKLVVQKINA